MTTFQLTASKDYLPTPKRAPGSLEKAVHAARVAMGASFLPDDEIRIYEARNGRRTYRGKVARIGGIVEFVKGR